MKMEDSFEEDGRKMEDSSEKERMEWKIDLKRTKRDGR